MCKNILQYSTGKVGENLGVLREHLIWKHHPTNDFAVCTTHNHTNKLTKRFLCCLLTNLCFYSCFLSKQHIFSCILTTAIPHGQQVFETVDLFQTNRVEFVDLRIFLCNCGLCRSRKHPYFPHRRDWKFLGGRGFSKAQKVK